MLKKVKKVLLSLFAAFSLLLLLFIIMTLSPTTEISVFSVSVSPLLIAFLLLFISMSLLTGLLLKNMKQGLLVGVSLVVFFLLRFYNFHSILFAVLLLILFLLLFFVFDNSREKKTSRSSQAENG